MILHRSCDKPERRKTFFILITISLHALRMVLFNLFFILKVLAIENCRDFFVILFFCILEQFW